MQITAYDDNGNTFLKTLEVYHDPPIVSLGDFHRWYLNDIKQPSNDKFYIDAMGHNHNGSPVYVLYSELISLANKAIEDKDDIYQLKP